MGGAGNTMVELVNQVKQYPKLENPWLMYPKPEYPPLMYPKLEYPPLGVNKVVLQVEIEAVRQK
jgi:hypothetical protein